MTVSAHANAHAPFLTLVNQALFSFCRLEVQVPSEHELAECPNGL